MWLNSNEKQGSESIPICIYACIYMIVFFRLSFLNDDAYITFTVIDNLVNGYGLTFNIVERVQAFTNPLWLFLVTPFYALTKEFLVTVTLLSAVISLTGFLIVLKMQRDFMTIIFTGTALVLSVNYVNWSSSGLSNPLLYLLTAILLYYVYNSKQKRVWIATTLLSFFYLTRPDSVIYVIPVWALVCFVEWQKKDEKTLSSIIKEVAIGLSPAIIWGLFCLWYFGFPFPNTAYAKVFSAEIPFIDRMAEATSHYLYMAQFDPLLYIIGGIAVVSTFLSRSKYSVAFLLGVGLHWLYFVKIGGDFMGGRFFSYTYLLLVGVAAHNLKTILKKSHNTNNDVNASEYRKNQYITLATTLLVVMVGITSPFSTLESMGGTYSDVGMFSQGFGGFIQDKSVMWPNRRIKDSSSYFRKSNLMRAGRPPFREKINYKYQKKFGSVSISGNLGHSGLFSGPESHIIDIYALTDPLLSRLPQVSWHAGHLRRKIPNGYIPSIITGKNKISDPDLAKYYEHLKEITRGSLLSWDRIIDIFKMNIGMYDNYLDTYKKKYKEGAGQKVWVWEKTPQSVAWVGRKGKGNRWFDLRLKVERIKTNWSTGLAGKFGGNEYLSLEQPMKGKVKNLTVDAKFATSFQKYQILASFDRSEYFRIGTRGKKVLISLASDDDIADFDFPCDVADGVPHRLTVMFDGENTRLSLFVDDHLVGTRKTDFKYIGSSNNRRFGFIGVGSEARSKGGRIGPEAYFKGIIDKVSIYKSTPECQCPDGISSFSEGELMISETFGDNSGK